MFYQIGLQIVLLLVAESETATVGGFDKFFQQDSMFGIKMNPTTFIVISVIWSLKTSILLHSKILSMEKGFFGFKTKTVVFLWGLVSSVRRVLGIVAFFTPCLGLLDLLWHWHGEQFPFQVRLDNAQRFNITPSSEDKIELYRTREEVLWSTLDRWSYEDPQDPRAPPYSIYTGLSAKWTMITFIAIFILQALAVFLVKLCISADFSKEKGGVFQKTIHIISNTNIPSPYRDWDHGNLSVEEHKRRYKRTEREMIYLFVFNAIFSLTLLIPVWFTG